MLQINFISFSIKTLTYSLAFMLLASPAVQVPQAMAAPLPSAVQSTLVAFEAYSPVKCRIDARLNESNMRIHGSETATYQNTSLMPITPESSFFSPAQITRLRA